MADRDENPPAQEQCPSNIREHDITGCNDERVVDLMKSIVNGKGYKENVTYQFVIKPNEVFKKTFELQAKPSTDQPGNGKISVYLGDEKIGRAYGQEMISDLKEIYGNDTSAFARHLEKLFTNNATIAKYPFVTSEVYMLLLFERGRRSVKDSAKSTPRKNKFDGLPIREAIQNVLTLLDDKKCEFSDVFLKGGKFHCFSGEPEERKKVIDDIKKEIERKLDNLPEQLQQFSLEDENAGESDAD